jgi:hypothetical protein
MRTSLINKDDLVKSRQNYGFIKSQNWGGKGKSSRCKARNPAPSGIDGLFTKPSIMDFFTTENTERTQRCLSFEGRDQKNSFPRLAMN